MASSSSPKARPKPAAVLASFDRPVPRSQARARAQVALDRNRARVLALAGNPTLARILVRAQTELASRLRARRHPGNWSDLDTQASIAMVQAAMGSLGPRFASLLAANASAAGKMGAIDTVDMLAMLEQGAGGGKVEGGLLRPLSVNEAVHVEASVLERHAASIDRYGSHCIGLFKRELQTGILIGDTFDQVSTRIHRVGAPFLESRGWAERIVRTELMTAYNASALDEMHAQRDENFPTMQKRLIETFDSRTAQDSYGAHGEVRNLEDYFVDGAGRTYLYPPGRPNDRACTIPWLPSWDSHDALEQRPEHARGQAATANPSP